MRQEGYGGLYRGLKPNLLGVTPEKALKLTVNDVLRERFTRGNGTGKIKLWQEMASGAFAGFIQVAATNPMEIVKLRMQLQGESGVKKRCVPCRAAPTLLSTAHTLCAGWGAATLALSHACLHPHAVR